MANTYDDGTFTYKKASNVLSSIRDWLLTNSKLNDFTTGSILETLSEAESLEIEELYYLTVENMTTAIDDSVLQAFGFTRKSATYAYGTVRLVFNNTMVTTLTIPKGTIFSSSNNAYTQTYQTLQEYYVSAGQSAIDLTVYCTQAGTIGNIPSGVIDRCSDISGLSTITNPTAIQTGTDDESLIDLQTRFRSQIQALARGTVQSLKYATLSVENIKFVDIYEDVYGVVVVYCGDANGNLSDTLKQEVVTALESWRPAGINVIVRPINKSLTNITVALDMANTDLETDDFLTLVKNTVESYINSFNAGKSLYINDLIQKVMDVSDLGINDCSITVTVTPNYSISQDSLSDDTVVKVGGSSVSQTGLEPVDFSSATNYGLIGSQNTTSNTNTDDETGNSWSDATSTTDDNGNTTLNPITVVTRYITQNNEILKSNSVTVYFENNTNYVDYDNLTNVDTDSLDNLLGS